MIVVRPNFLEAHQCHTLVTSLMVQHDAYIGRSAANRIEIPAWEATPEAREVLNGYRTRVTCLMHDLFGSRVMLEYLMLQANFPGDYHVAHCDNCTDDGGPNHTPYRSHTCNLYLGNGFEGGELTFPELGISTKPTSGTVVAFPSHRGFKHQVLPVTSSVRYSVLGWFTEQPAREMRPI
jgi:hypothetical protein